MQDQPRARSSRKTGRLTISVKYDRYTGQGESSSPPKSGDEGAEPAPRLVQSLSVPSPSTPGATARVYPAPSPSPSPMLPISTGAGRSNPYRSDRSSARTSKANGRGGSGASRCSARRRSNATSQRRSRSSRTSIARDAEAEDKRVVIFSTHSLRQRTGHRFWELSEEQEAGNRMPCVRFIRTALDDQQRVGSRLPPSSRNSLALSS